jgi:competence protein ComFB
MALKDSYDFDLIVNIMKDIVIAELEKQLQYPEASKICKCQECILDITAIALNQVKPMYGSQNSFKGAMYKNQISEKSGAEVAKAVKKAIYKVVNHPECKRTAANNAKKAASKVVDQPPS